MSAAEERRALVALALLAGLPAAAQTTVIPASQLIESGLAVGPGSSAFLLTAFLLTASMSAPVLGRLGDLHGRRPLLLGAMALFTAGNVICYVGISRLEWLVVGRVMQGISAGSFVLAVATVNEQFSPRRKLVAMGVLAGVVGIGPIVGFVVGGAAAQLSGLPAVFGLPSVAGIITFALAWRWVPSSGGRAEGGLDLPGAVLVGGVLASGLLLIASAGRPGLISMQALLLSTAFAMLLVTCGLVESRRRAPLLDPRLLRRPVIAWANAATVSSACATLMLLVTVPRMVQEAPAVGAALGPLGAALVLVPGAVAMVVASPVAGRAGGVHGHGGVVRVGAVVATLGFCVLLVGGSSLAVVVIGACVVSIGIGLTLGCLPTMVMAGAPSDRLGEAAGSNSLARGVGSAIGAQVSASVLEMGEFTRDAYEVAFMIAALFALATTVLVRWPPE